MWRVLSSQIKLATLYNAVLWAWRNRGTAAEMMCIWLPVTDKCQSQSSWKPAQCSGSPLVQDVNMLFRVGSILLNLGSQIKTKFLSLFLFAYKMPLMFTSKPIGGYEWAVFYKKLKSLWDTQVEVVKYYYHYHHKTDYIKMTFHLLHFFLNLLCQFHGIIYVGSNLLRSSSPSLPAQVEQAVQGSTQTDLE